MSLAIIAGKGDLPQMIINKCLKDKRKFILVLIKGQLYDKDYSKYNPHIIHIGHIGEALRIFKENEITQIVLAGGISKPSMANIKVDSKGAILLSKITKAKLFGDNNVLTSVTKFFEKEGFEIIGVDQIIDNLLTKKGVLGKIKPSKENLQDIELGKNLIKAISEFDVGQSVVTQQKQILSIEDVGGTDALINRCGNLQLKIGSKPVLVKIKKSGQNTKVDLPSLGVETIHNLHKSNFAGVALEAKSSLIINKEEVLKLANQYDIFLIGI